MINRKKFTRQLIAGIRAASVPGANAESNSQWDDQEVGYYFNPDGSPCCILGAGLAKVGVTYDMLSGTDAGYDDVNGGGVGDLYERLAELWDYQAEKLLNDVEEYWLDIAQSSNDNRETWADAVLKADREVLERYGEAGLAKVRDAVNKPEELRKKKPPRVEMVTGLVQQEQPAYQEVQQ